jgi:hypothetical protein
MTWLPVIPHQKLIDKRFWNVIPLMRGDYRTMRSVNSGYSNFDPVSSVNTIFVWRWWFPKSQWQNYTCSVIGCRAWMVCTWEGNRTKSCWVLHTCIRLVPT